MTKGKGTKVNKKQYWFWAEIALFYTYKDKVNTKNPSGFLDRQFLLVVATNHQRAFKKFHSICKSFDTSKSKTSELLLDDKPGVCFALGIINFGICMDRVDSLISNRKRALNYAEITYAKSNCTKAKAFKLIPSQDKLLRNVSEEVNQSGYAFQ
ncbi:hypothetical protein JNK13_04170 [bacterium]|nr:hypothetical protein [bacterium]